MELELPVKTTGQSVRRAGLSSPDIAESRRSMERGKYAEQVVRLGREICLDRGFGPIVAPTYRQEALRLLLLTEPLHQKLMDALVDILYVLCRWRLVLSLATSVAVAVVLSNVFAWFTAGYCVALAIFGAAFGIIWQARGDAGVSLTADVASPPISKPVAFLSFAFVGVVWGGVATYLFNSFAIAASALVVFAVAVGLWYRFANR
jgi:hypothetical protein